ncbi:LacI family DNA-binding transcriptional regulator [Rossellomorea sp. NS-SX7]|uniref:LacI family DNA-binding transcriptional regulator n=1 Tax=Rossellomorea sp. NS-SX7 TaxID=3463856 RepID=UPI004059E32A
MTTIGDVAREAGVSKSTVSNVFSKKRPISVEVTNRVIEVASRLNYVPNHMARSLATKKTMIIGLKMPTYTEYELSSFETKIINSVVKKCSENGYRVLLDRIVEEDEMNFVSNDPVDGVILLNPRDEDQRILKYKASNIPFVIIGRPNDRNGETKYVDNNNTEMVKEVGEYLIGLGHKDILFLNASLHMTVAEDRKAGLRQAFENYSLPFIEEDVMYYDPLQCKDGSQYGYTSFLENYQKKKYTAIIADTDRVALGVIRASRDLGIDIPNDVSLVALSNNETLAHEITPKLTSMELQPEKLGEEAASILMSSLNNELSPKYKMIPAKLVQRDSCKGIKVGHKQILERGR